MCGKLCKCKLCMWTIIKSQCQITSNPLSQNACSLSHFHFDCCVELVNAIIRCYCIVRHHLNSIVVIQFVFECVCVFTHFQNAAFFFLHKLCAHLNHIHIVFFCVWNKNSSKMQNCTKICLHTWTWWWYASVVEQ